MSITTANSPWTSPEVVARFSTSPPNDVLMAFAREEHHRCTGNQLLDIGCGAGSNAIPLARMGYNVIGLDRSEPMLAAGNARAIKAGLAQHIRFEIASMDQLPIADNTQDFIVAHGIWNLATSSRMFRQAVQEAARVTKLGAALFIYTFSRSTLPTETTPTKGQPFVFTEFSGRPQCFLTEQQLIEELGRGGFELEENTTITCYPSLETTGKPAILEAILRKVSD